MAEDQEFTMPSLEERPLVTFALFAYNQEKYIRKAVEGAFAQTYEPLEIILSDDCSTDRTFEIMAEMVNEYRGPHRIKLGRTVANLGGTKFGRRVWNLLAEAKGEFIVLGAGDDISKPERTFSLFNLWCDAGRPRVCVHSKAQPTDQNGEQVGPPVGNNNVANVSILEFIENDGRGVIGATNAICRSLLDNFSPLPDKILLEDGALAFRARLCDGILFSNDALVYYRGHGENLTNGRELTDRSEFKKYISSLIGQHSSYLSDCATTFSNSKPELLKAIGDRIRRINDMSNVFSRNILKRINAMRIYSKRFSWKRRVWLLLWVIKIKS